MRHYIVVLDKHAIPGEARVPVFEHVWAEYPSTSQQECTDHLWRANIGVTHHVPINADNIDGCVKLQLIVVMGENVGMVDAAACQARGIEIIHLPPDGAADQSRLDRMMDVVEAFIARVYG